VFPVVVTTAPIDLSPGLWIFTTANVRVLSFDAGTNTVQVEVQTVSLGAAGGAANIQLIDVPFTVAVMAP
jgi:hypothetical protein